MAALSFCLLVAAAIEAWGHDDPDCAPIPDSAVMVRADGYAVEIWPGEHPALRASIITALIPQEAVRASRDGRFHACLTASGHIRRLYAPLGY